MSFKITADKYNVVLPSETTMSLETSVLITSHVLFNSGANVIIFTSSNVP